MASSSAVASSAEPVPWWLVLLQGIAGLLIGLLLLTQPGATLFTIVLLMAATAMASTRASVETASLAALP
jgi:uncharacterized membrane protein HdeD (DUF308 family)